MLPMDPLVRPEEGSPEPRPGADPLRPVGDPLRPDAEPLPLDAGVLPPDADVDPLRGSDEPPRSEDGGLRDVGFIGWLGTRRLRESYPRRGRLGASTPQKRGLSQRAAVDPGGDQAQLVLRQRVPG